MNKKIIKIGESTLDLTRPVVMGILNVTPDSFYAGSRNFDDEQVRERVRKIAAQGASIIDIGGYSSRPGADDVSPDEEVRRVSVGVGVAMEEAPGIVVSVDTFRAEVAAEVLERFGPCIINDISAGELDPAIVDVVAQYGVPYIAMHMRGRPDNMQQHTAYGNIADEVKEYLSERAAWLESRGVKDIILDPGFGFAKTTAQNYELLAGLNKICALGYPVLAGISRKSMIYSVLDTTPAGSLFGTVALGWECLRQGSDILRVHDVAPAADEVKLFNYYMEHAGQR